MSNLAYATPNEVRPNRDREIKCETKDNKSKLYIMEFIVRGGTKGCAVVKANNPNNAIKILFSNGRYNGTPTVYEVTRVEEIIESPDEMLICEQIL